MTEPPLPASAFLVGERVYLRTWEEGDLEAGLRTVSNEEIRPWLAVTTPMTREAELAFIRGSVDPASHVSFVICERATGRVVGSCALREFHAVHRHAELGVALPEAADRDRGLGGEALRLLLRYGFKELNLRRVWLGVFDGNPSRRLYERLGFREEGRLRGHVFKGGVYRDVVLMGLLRAEWEGGGG